MHFLSARNSFRRGRLISALIAIALLSGCSRHKSGHFLYGSNCGICHHGGQGMAGSVPPLTGRIDRIASTPEGKRYLAAVLMNGLSGPMRANGMSYEAEMPPFRYLSDEEAALILTYLSGQGSTVPAPVITAADVAEARAHRVGASGTASMREALDREHSVP
ncbi:c-type cytochrome [Acetobacter fallax]|uniref:C-type cytochrome n=1 Tax=Acetobacter fallax TaxID=1737473 RepID=A0ABX0K991_9PROT|nr:cytochrome c [Acetobacter fallax]NHO31773.1 c-type cytochrome [Acetobacter fallax]NHO35332.1 c-type cytochrome [Acetobacter fallax]